MTASSIALPNWTLSPKQVEFWQTADEKQLVAYVGGIRAGKTWVGVRRLIFEAVKRGGLCWCVTPTYTMMGAARRTFEEALVPTMLMEKRETPFPLYKLWRDRSKGTFVEIEFRSADKADNLRGPSLQAILLDEGAQLDDEVLMENGVAVRRCEGWNILLGRVLNTGGPVIVTTTPKGKNWLYEEFVLRPTEVHGLIHAKTEENPTLDPVLIKLLRRQYSGNYGLQELDAAFTDGGGVFFAEWKDHIHVCEPFEVPESWAHYGGFDDGYSKPFSFGLYAQDPEGALYRIDELYGAGLTTPEKAQKIATLIRKRAVRRIVCDPAIWAKKSDTGESTADVLGRELRKRMSSKTPPLVKGSNNRHEGWKRCREWLYPEAGVDFAPRARFKCFSTCTQFRRVIPALPMDANDLEDVDTNSEDHIADEWRYVLMDRPRPAGIFPVNPEPNTGAWLMKRTMEKLVAGSKYIRGPV